MYYFAYGSNMLYARLARRVPSAKPLGAARLHGYVLRFHKHGADGSGKCNAYGTGRREDVTYGALYHVDENKLAKLHAAEGPGYEFATVNVETERATVRAATYLARNAWIDDALAPFTWYQAFVVGGAKENALPADYINYLENLFARRDPNVLRHWNNRFIVRGSNGARRRAMPKPGRPDAS